MKKSQNKTQPTKVSVYDFIAAVENEERRKDTETLIRMMKKITKKLPVMWGPSIIGFDQVHYKYESGREGDMGAMGFSPRKTNLAVYIVEGVSKHKDLLDKLGPHKTGKVCLYIKRLADIDLKILEQILTKSYKYVMAHKTNMHRAE